MRTVRLDFFLDYRARLTEQERALMTTMLAGLVAMAADEFASMLADAGPANDDGERLFDRLWKARLLDTPELLALLLRRAEEERIAAGVRAAWPAGKGRFLQSLVSDEDSDASAAAMALILARGRRRDRYDSPRLAFDDLSAESAVALVNAIAAALRGDLVRRLGTDEADEHLARSARALLSGHDEGNRLEAKLFDLVHALDRAGRVDGQLIRSALKEGEVAFLVEALGRRAGISFETGWEHFTGGGGRLAILLRMAGISRDLAGEIATSVAEIVGSDAETEIQEFDCLSDDEVDRARKWLRLDVTYRQAICALDAEDGERTV